MKRQTRAAGGLAHQGQIDDDADSEEFKQWTVNKKKRRIASSCLKRGANMATTDYSERSRGGGIGWIMIPVVLIVFLGGALSIGAYFHSEPDLTILESVAVGFGGLAAIIIGLFAAALGIIVGLVGALIGVVAAGGAVAVTLFIVGSPIIALVLIFMMMRRRGGGADPAAHE